MNKNVNWIYKVFLLSFIFSSLFSGISSFMADSFNTIVVIIILLFVIFIGILFDMIGVSVLTSNEASLHAKASKKIKGAKEAITLLKNATQVSSICQDVIGDICGIVSGSLGAVLAVSLLEKIHIPSVIITILITAIISSLTVGCKAIGKNIAAKKCDTIVFLVGKVKHLFKIK